AVHAVIRDARRHVAFLDALQGRRSRKAAELRKFEKQLRRLAVSRDIRCGKAVREAQAGKGKPAHRVAGKGRETLRIVGVVVLKSGIDRHLGTQQKPGLAGGVVVELIRKYGEAGGNGAIEKIRFREAEYEVFLNIADLGRQREGFAQAEEIVGLIRQSQETAGNSADASREADGLFLFFVQFQTDIHRAGLGVLLEVGVFGLERIEVIELIEP